MTRLDVAHTARELVYGELSAIELSLWSITMKFKNGGIIFYKDFDVVDLNLGETGYVGFPLNNSILPANLTSFLGKEFDQLFVESSKVTLKFGQHLIECSANGPGENVICYEKMPADIVALI